MNTTVEKNNPKIFPQNEGKINSKGMVAPPVPPKSSQAKFAGIKAILSEMYLILKQMIVIKQ